MKRQKIILFLWPIILIGCLIAGIIIWRDYWLAIPSSDGLAIHLVIDNRTGHELGPFVISDAQSHVKMITGYLEPFSTTSFDLVTSEEIWGENGITMLDTSGRKFIVVGYFEHSIRGRVDIRIECASSNGLSGRWRDFTSVSFSLKWRPWGYPDCR